MVKKQENSVSLSHSTSLEFASVKEKGGNFILR